MKKLLTIAAAVTLFASFAAAQEIVPAPEIVTPPSTNVVIPETPPAPVTQPQPHDAMVPPPAAAAPPETIAAAPPVKTFDSPAMSAIELEMSQQLAYLNPTIKVDDIPSLFFTVWEHDLLRDARRGLNARDPNAPDDEVEIEMGPRDISLGGIVYASGKDWTIWLNNTRISPTRIPEEVMDLKVHKDYIDLEWFDKSTNQIFPIRLRPHQRFNLDTRMFLPG